MTINEEIFKRMQDSLKAAKDALKVKDKIESEISSVLSMVRVMTEGGITYSISNNNGEPKFEDCERIIYLSKNGVLFGQSLILCGFTVHKTSGYPVSIETDAEYFNCDDEDTLKTTLADIISSEKNAMAIISLISKESEVPF